MFVAHHIDAQLQLEIRNNAEEVGVTAHVSVAIRRALHMRGARLYCSKATGDCDVGAVVRMDAHLARHFPDHSAYHVRNAGGDRPAVRVAKDNAVGTAGGSGLQALERVIPVRLEAVEEMFGIEEDGPPGLLQMAYRIPNHREILF